MRHKKKQGGPVPPDNQPQAGPAEGKETDRQTAKQTGASVQEQDAQRRLGDYEGTGEHAFQQPGGKNDANH